MNKVRKKKKRDIIVTLFGYTVIFSVGLLLFACGQGSTLAGLTTTSGTTTTSNTTTTTGGTTTTTAGGPPPPATYVAPGYPALAFSDLSNAPKTGWEGSTTKGAAVSIWGTGLGSARGTSYVTVNGASLSNDTDYAEWGVPDARGLQRVTFWLNSTCQNGNGTITVTANGKTSNPLPFQVVAGNIYFIAKTGSDSNTGKYSAVQSGTSGPWLHFYMANPIKHNLKGGDVVYVRGGNYDDIDEQGYGLYLRGPYNGTGPYFSVTAYPAEYPVLFQNSTSVQGIAKSYATSATAWTGYVTFAKLTSYADTGEIDMTGGHHWRIIGNTFRNCTKSLWAGMINGAPGHDVYIYGNIFRDSGYDYYKHAVYFSAYFGTNVQSSAYNIDIGWNEFNNYRSDLGAAGTLGAGMLNFRNADFNWETYNIYIHENLFHDSPTSQALKLENVTHHVYFNNNILYNIGQSGSSSAVGALGIGSDTAQNTYYVYNNTLYNDGSAATPTYFIRLAGSATAYSKNNIYYSVGSEPFVLNAGGSTTHLYSDHDLWFGMPVPTGSYLTVTNAFTSDPLFVNAAGYDFHLQSTSPAVDTGTSDVSSLVTDDYDLGARPQNAGYDIGAYEYHP